MPSLRLRLLAQTLPFLLILPGLALAQAAPPTRAEAEAALPSPGPAAAYTPQQIDQLAAPIALYPDGLLTQVLMAATYPDQLIDAAQWLQDPGHAALKGNELVAALEPLPWDPSVKSLVAFPQVVTMLAQHIDWAQALGVAFSTQQSEVMAQLQVLRRVAMRSGRLHRLHHLLFREEAGEIVILPAQSNEIYVPVYNPVVIYGTYWPAPDYPPVYVPPPPGFVGETIAPGLEVSVGFGVVGRLWGWSRPDWHRHRITIERREYQRITRNVVVGPGGTWSHRGPVVLASPRAAARFAPPRAAAMPKGTIAPAHAAAVTALPQRAAHEPSRIRAATQAPAAHEQATGHPGEHPAAHEQATGHPGEHPAAHEQAIAHPGEHPAAHEQAITHPGEHPAAHEQAIAHPGEHPAAHEQAIAHPGEHPAAHDQAIAHPGEHPAAHDQAIAHPGEHPAAHEQAIAHPGEHPAAHEQAIAHPGEHPAPHEQAIAHPPAPHEAPHEQAIAHPPTPHAAPREQAIAHPPAPHAAPHEQAAAHPPAHPEEKKDERP
jgi:hypothetical protein